MIAFNCPNCGAGLEAGGTQPGIRCPYCNQDVRLPEQAWAELVQAETRRRWGRYLVIFLAITVGLPTCVGLVAALIGLAGSLAGVILPFLLALRGGAGT
jgi:hypothetical protein